MCKNPAIFCSICSGPDRLDSNADIFFGTVYCVVDDLTANQPQSSSTPPPPPPFSCAKNEVDERDFTPRHRNLLTASISQASGGSQWRLGTELKGTATKDFKGLEFALQFFEQIANIL